MSRHLPDVRSPRTSPLCRESPKSATARRVLSLPSVSKIGASGSPGGSHRLGNFGERRGRAVAGKRTSENLAPSLQQGGDLSKSLFLHRSHFREGAFSNRAYARARRNRIRRVQKQ